MSQNYYGFLDAFLSDHGEIVDAAGERAVLAELTGRDTVTLFVSGTQANIVFAPVPARSESEARRAAPFAIEDEIAQSVEDVHIALGAAPDETASAREIHVVARETMQVWQAFLSGHSQLGAARLVAAQSVLDEGDVFALEAGYIGKQSGRSFALERTLPEAILSGFLGADRPEPAQEHSVLSALAHRAEARTHLVDLRQGDFKARRTLQLAAGREWKLTAGLAAACALALGMNSYLRISSLSAATERIEASIERTYADALPNAPKPDNYVRAVSQAVQGQAGGGQLAFLSASSALYEALELMPDAQLTALRFDGDAGTLIATVAYARYGNDAELKDFLAAAGFDATLGNARQDRAGVIGDVTIRGGTS